MSIPAYPVGYPYINSPTIYGTQNLTIDGSIKNVGSGSITNVLVTVTIQDLNSNLVAYVLNNANTNLDELQSKSLSDIAVENGIQIPLQWSPGISSGQHYVNITVNFDSISKSTRTDSFVVGETQLLDFKNVRTNNMTYEKDENITLYSGASIENTGNRDISGNLTASVWKWNNLTKSWNTSFRIIGSTPITLNSGEIYYLSGIWPSSGPDISSYGNGTFKVNFAVTDNRGNILEQKVGHKRIGEMQLGIPSIKVEKFLEEPILPAGNQKARVNLRVMPSGDSLRDSGIFTIGEESRVTDLDIVFVADTSGSMGNEWRDLVDVMEDIINSLSEYGDVTHSVYGLSNTYSGYTTYTVNGVTYPIQKLKEGYIGGNTMFSDGAESNMGNWIYDNFSIDSNTAYSGASSFCTGTQDQNHVYYSGQGYYASNYMTTTIDLAGITTANLAFSTRYDCSNSYPAYVQVSTDGSNWNTLDTFKGYQSSLTDKNYDLSAYAGQQIYLRFLYGTYYSYYEGFFVDDIVVKDGSGSTIFSDDVENGDGKWTMSGFSVSTDTTPYIYVSVSTDNSNWQNVDSFESTSSTWEQKVIDLNSYVGYSNVYLRFNFTDGGDPSQYYMQTVQPINLSSVSRAHLSFHYKYSGSSLYLDDIKLDDSERIFFHSESYGPGTEYLAQKHNWRPGSVRVIFPIGDEGPYKGEPNNYLDTQSIDAAIIACNANDVIAYPMYGDLSYSPDEEAKNIAHMERLAASTGGVATHWQDRETVLELVNTSVAGEIKFAGTKIAITENILNTSDIQVDMNSFTAYGIPFVPKSVQTVDEITRVVIDKDDVQQLDSIATVPPEEVLIQYDIELSNLSKGELREITRAGMLNYTDIMEEPQNESIPTSGESTYVRVNAESNVLVIVDWNRMYELYNENDVNDLAAVLDDYAVRKDATIYNLSEYRLYWENNTNNNVSAYSSDNEKREWARYLDNVIASLVLDRNAEHVVIVGGDNAVPFYSVDLNKEPVEEDWECQYNILGQIDHSYDPWIGYDISNAQDNNLWSDEPYSDLNGDYYPDISIGRLPGNPKTIEVSLGNAILQYKSEISLMAGMASTVNNRDKQVATLLENEWGFNEVNTYFEESPFFDWWVIQIGEKTDDVVDIVDAKGLNFTQRLSNDNNSIIYMNGHGNDYGEFWEPHKIYDENDFDGNKLYLTASDINIKNSVHPFVSSESCHGGIVFPEDDLNPERNFPLSFLSNGAVGYLGSTGYAPFGGSDDLGYYFYKFAKEKNEIGKSLLLAKRELLSNNDNSQYWVAAFEFELYGDPTYTINVPNDPPGIVGYNFTTYENSSSIDISLVINDYNVTDINISNSTMQLVQIPGAFEYLNDYKPVIPVITYNFELPSGLDVRDLNYFFNDSITIQNLTLPLYKLGAKSVGGGYVSSANYQGELYPNKTVEVIKVEEVSMNKTVTIRIYPVQYNHTRQEGVFYNNFTITSSKVEEPPLPLARLSASMGVKEVNLLSGLKDDFYVTVKNNGELDLKDVNITGSLPEGFTLVSSPGTFNETTGVLNIEQASLSTDVLNDFQTFTCTVRPPNVQGNTDYVFNVTFSCIDEAGLPLAPISRSVTLNVKKPESADVHSVISTHTIGGYDRWDVFSVIQAYKSE